MNSSVKKIFVVTLAVVLAAGCSSGPRPGSLPSVDDQTLLAGEAFPGAISQSLPAAEDVFGLSPDMVSFLDENVSGKTDERAFADLITAMETFGIRQLIYDNQTRTASQTFEDRHGNCLYLNERDCSIQRRHQKVVEEAPAPGLTPELRRAMGEAAVKAAQAIGYVGAGTVEFLLDARGQFFFMEMNTRLQVEHPVTEMISGQDLVEWQLRVANGEPLPCTQDQLTLKGHAFEARIYAEDPEHDFLPSTGQLTELRSPLETNNVRIDSGVVEGDEVSVFYDPMIAKVIATASSRSACISRMSRALSEYMITGIKTTIPFQQAIMQNSSFREGKYHTGFVEQLLREPAP